MAPGFWAAGDGNAADLLGRLRCASAGRTAVDASPPGLLAHSPLPAQRTQLPFEFGHLICVWESEGNHTASAVRQRWLTLFKLSALLLSAQAAGCPGGCRASRGPQGVPGAAGRPGPVAGDLHAQPQSKALRSHLQR